MPHVAACIIGEPPYIKPFDAAHQLNGENNGEVSDCKRYHGRKGLIPLHDIEQALCQPPFKIGSGNHTNVIKDT